MNSNIRASLPILLVTFGTVAAWAFPFGPPNGYTTAPGDKPGAACTQCHTGTALNGGGGSVRLAFPNGLTYTPGQTQSVTVIINDAIASIYGFEISARLESGPSTLPAGNLVAGTNQKVVCSDNKTQPAGGCGGTGIQWLEHSSPSLSNTITVQWTPPASNSGNVHLYVSANAANGDNTSRNDHIYAADYVLTPAAVAPVKVPTISGIANGAGGAAGAEAGSWITITGTNFAQSAVTWDNAIVANVFPTTLGDVTVAIDGKPAPIAFVSATQINALVPATNSLGAVGIVVSNANGSSAPGTLTLSPSAPGMFTFSQNSGRYAAGIVLNSPTTFDYLAPAGLLGSSVSSRPARAGETVVLYATGLGPTTTLLNPAVAASVAYPLAHTGADITLPLAQVTIGGQPATLSFIGLTSPGVYQINAVVPSGLSAGDQQVNVSLLIGTSTSQTFYIPVQ